MHKKTGETEEDQQTGLFPQIRAIPLKTEKKKKTHQNQGLLGVVFIRDPPLYL